MTATIYGDKNAACPETGQAAFKQVDTIGTSSSILQNPAKRLSLPMKSTWITLGKTHKTTCETNVRRFETTIVGDFCFAAGFCVEFNSFILGATFFGAP